MAAHPYVRLARETAERLLRGLPLIQSGSEIDPDASLWEPRRACFVSIKKTNGDLRGCIGTIMPCESSLDREIIMNAISSSTRDPRFHPMTQEELPGVVFSVDVLSEPVPAEAGELDPKIWGVIVSAPDGRRGVLLPDLEGVDTVEEQLAIACSKACIGPSERYAIAKFKVERYRERDDIVA